MVRRLTMLALLAVVLAACTGTHTARPEGDTPAVIGFPVQVQHKYGNTSIGKPPQKAVTLGLSDHDAVLARGLKPVGALDWFGERPFGVWPWAAPLWAGTRSSEQVDVLEVDRLVWLCADPSAQARVKSDRLYSKLNVAVQGRVIFVPYTDPPIGAAFSFHTVLSIPYALERAVPLLAAIK